MSHITRGIARNLSCAIRQRERQYLEREKKERDTERIVPQQTDGPFSLIFLSYSYRKPRREGKRMPCSFFPSHSLFSPFSCLLLPSFLHFFFFFCPSFFTLRFLKILLTLELFLLSPSSISYLDVLISCFSPHPQLSYPSLELSHCSYSIVRGYICKPPPSLSINWL